MKTMYAKRLLKLADALVTIPNKNFDLERYVTGNISKELLLGEVNRMVETKNPIGCGYAACAIGHLPLVFPKNFHYQNNSYGVAVFDDENRDNDVAAIPFFNLTYAAIEYLFMPDSYRKGHRGPRSVATRIRKFVANGMPKKFKTYD